ncbi:MAG: hypothetical protein J6Z34_06415 [Clostridia bacterium]|nr:hypothetical protein [Clostridia bacterium]
MKVVIKKSVVLVKNAAGEKRELAVAEIRKNSRGITVSVKRGDAAGIVYDGGAQTAPLSGGTAEFFFNGDNFGVGIFENGELTFYGESGTVSDGKTRLLEECGKNSVSAYGIYDDYAIAESDYFEENSRITREKGRFSKTIKEENDNDGTRVFKESENASAAAGAFKAKEKGGDIFDENEGGGRGGESGKEEGYYGRIKDALSKLLDTFPREKELEKAVDGGSFVKIRYSDTKYYVVGTTEFNGAPEYVIFGVPAPQDGKQPKEFNGAAYFVPCKIPEGGYFLFYRDAFTGEVLSASNK